MKKAIFFVYFICLVVSGLSAQNWDINTLHRVNSWDGKFVRNYNKIISRSEPRQLMDSVIRLKRREDQKL